mgnify:CR=1 FL=1
MKQHVLKFLVLHRDSSTWNCEDFAAAVQGKYPKEPCRGQCQHVDYHTGEWDLEDLGRTEPPNLKPGDFVGLEGGYVDGHAAIYLGEGFYLSKDGYDKGFIICKMEDMQKPYQSLTLYSLK